MGIAYKIRRSCFGLDLGVVTPINPINIVDFTILNKGSLAAREYIEVDFLPNYADHYRFHYYSLDPSKLLIDEFTGLAVPVSEGEVTVAVEEEYSHIRKEKQFTVITSLEIILNSTNLTKGKRTTVGSNSYTNTLTWQADSGQCYLDPSSPLATIPAGFKRLRLGRMGHWLSGGGSGYDTQSLIFLDSSNKVLRFSSGYRGYFNEGTNGQFNWNDEPMEFAVPSDAVKWILGGTVNYDDAQWQGDIQLTFFNHSDNAPVYRTVREVNASAVGGALLAWPSDTTGNNARASILQCTETMKGEATPFTGVNASLANNRNMGLIEVPEGKTRVTVAVTNSAYKFEIKTFTKSGSAWSQTYTGWQSGSYSVDLNGASHISVNLRLSNDGGLGVSCMLHELIGLSIAWE